jgi:hypothetical protein
LFLSAGEQVLSAGVGPGFDVDPVSDEGCPETGLRVVRRHD